MLPVRLLAALAAVFCFSACALPVGIPGVPEAPAASESVSDEADVDDQDADEADSDNGDTGASSTPAAEWTPRDTSDIQSHGAESKECLASTELTKAASGLGMTAATGGVTQELYDKVFAASVVNDLPADAAAPLEALRSATKALIGDNPLESDDNVETWTYALLDWQYVMLKICS